MPMSSRPVIIRSPTFTRPVGRYTFSSAWGMYSHRTPAASSAFLPNFDMATGVTVGFFRNSTTGAGAGK